LDMSDIPIHLNMIDRTRITVSMQRYSATITTGSQPKIGTG
jgi:hypothetical protein